MFSLFLHDSIATGLKDEAINGVAFLLFYFEVDLVVFAVMADAYSDDQGVVVEMAAAFLVDH